MNDIRATFRDHAGFDLHEEQVLLVGSNPLPVAVAALALRPAMGVHLVHTPDVARRTERIAALLITKGITVKSQPLLNDPHSAPLIQQALDAADFGHIDWTRVGLHYTGGTKPMVTQVHAHWSAKRGCPAQASYLGADATLRFENRGSPAQVSLRDTPVLSLAELTQLHTGLTPELGDEHRHESSLAVAGKIHAFVQKPAGFDAYRKLLPPIYGENQDIFLQKDRQSLRRAKSFDLAHDRNFGDEAFGGWPCQPLCEAIGISGATLDDVGDSLHEGSRPSKKKDMQERRLGDAQWLWGKWLEVWLADVLESARDDDNGPLFHEVHQNVELKRDRQSFFETDVVAIRGHRAFLFSCTVDKKNRLVKSKLFEAGQRTVQLGGDHARFAVVSFHGNPDSVVRELEEDGWEGYDTARSFGQADLASADVLLAKIRPWVLR
jgi:hypothetical protein